MIDDRAQRQLAAAKLMLQYPQIEKRDYVRITRTVTIEGPWDEVAMGSGSPFLGGQSSLLGIQWPCTRSRNGWERFFPSVP